MVSGITGEAGKALKFGNIDGSTSKVIGVI